MYQNIPAYSMATCIVIVWCTSCWVNLSRYKFLIFNLSFIIISFTFFDFLFFLLFYSNHVNRFDVIKIPTINFPYLFYRSTFPVSILLLPALCISNSLPFYLRPTFKIVLLFILLFPFLLHLILVLSNIS